MVEEIERLFPLLQAGAYRITSPRAREYNCIAWAAGDAGRWWWPDEDAESEAIYWPASVAREETVAAFIAVFSILGYVSCSTEELEVGFERVALFAANNGSPTHAARQLSNGRWTSKLGFLEDIEHTLHELEGEVYGNVVQVLRRSASFK